MFQSVEPAPPDAILGLTEAFKDDSNPKKVNLGVGVYKDAKGRTPVLGAVKEAEKRILEEETTKSYMPIPGEGAYGTLVRSMLFGAQNDLVAGGRAHTAHTPGGTGALRVGAETIRLLNPDASIWLTSPTWANHKNVFGSVDLPMRDLPYYDADSFGLDVEAWLEGLRQVPAGDVVLFHACCHNPTGVDPTAEIWKKVAAIAVDRGFMPFVDFAYQGFGDGLEPDREGLGILLEQVPECMIASSFSKNFGLYRERTGAFTLVGETPDQAAAAFSHTKKRIRSNYSNPPAHGGLVVQTILEDGELRARWEGELTGMRDRINTTRADFVKALADRGVERDFSFITRQRGMFSFSGLTRDQVGRLREEYSIYIVGSGRINVAGITPDNMDYLCDAMADVLKTA